MSETSTESTENATADEGTESAETDWQAMARKHEKAAKELRAQLRDAQPKLAEFDRLKASQQTELERYQAHAKESEDRANKAERDLVKNRIALEKGLELDDLEFIHGDDEASIVASAEKFLARTGDRSKPRPPRPDLSQGSSANGSTVDSGRAELAAAIRNV